MSIKSRNLAVYDAVVASSVIIRNSSVWGIWTIGNSMLNELGIGNVEDRKSQKQYLVWKDRNKDYVTILSISMNVGYQHT